MDERGEGLYTIKSCGRFFDLENFEIRKDKLGTNKGSAALLVLIFIALMGATLSLSAIFFSDALGRMKDTGQWIQVSSTAARVLLTPTVINSSSCAADHAALLETTSLKPAELNAICNSLGTAELDKFVQDTVFEQRVTGAAVTAILVTLICFLLDDFFSKAAAKSLQSRLARFEKDKLDRCNHILGSDPIHLEVRQR